MREAYDSDVGVDDGVLEAERVPYALIQPVPENLAVTANAVVNGLDPGPRSVTIPSNREPSSKGEEGAAARFSLWQPAQA